MRLDATDEQQHRTIAHAQRVARPSAITGGEERVLHSGRHDLEVDLRDLQSEREQVDEVMMGVGRHPGWLRWLNGSPSAADVPFEWKFVNYAPFLTVGALIVLWIGWHLSAKKWFTGPKMTIDLPAGVSSADEIALEHEHKGYHQPPNS